jgi:ABC-type polysaccharide/polyol phosphate export permease
MFSSINIFYQLLRADLFISFKNIKERIIDTVIWVVATAVVLRYVFPVLGMPVQYAAEMAMVGVASAGAFEVCGYELVSDYFGDQIISYQLTLPIPSWMIFLKIACNRAIGLLVRTSIILPLNKLILGDVLKFSAFSFARFCFASMAASLFFGLFSILGSSVPSEVSDIERTWIRLIFPLWYFGGAMFTFSSIFYAFPKLSMALLLNPFVYATEGLRVSVLGESASVIPFWTSMVVLSLFAGLLSWWGIARFRKKLDFI